MAQDKARRRWGWDAGKEDGGWGVKGNLPKMLCRNADDGAGSQKVGDGHELIPSHPSRDPALNRSLTMPFCVSLYAFRADRCCFKEMESG